MQPKDYLWRNPALDKGIRPNTSNHLNRGLGDPWGELHLSSNIAVNPTGTGQVK